MECVIHVYSAVLYNLVKTVAHVLSLPLTLHHTLAPRLAHLKDDDPDSHKYDNVPPEVALLVAAVIVLKMVYGLDGRTRCVSELASA
jgi:RNA polymerase I-specific transcription initiation factor RRN7